MLKKIVVLAGAAAAAFAVKKKLDQDQASKNLWAQAADNPRAGTSDAGVSTPTGGAPGL